MSGWFIILQKALTNMGSYSTLSVPYFYHLMLSYK